MGLWRMRRRTGCPFRARYRLVLRTWPMANPPGHLAEQPRPAALDATQRQASGPASSGCGYCRPAATASPLSICGVPPMGACRAALLSAVLQIVRSFLPTSLAIPPEVLPSAAGPACRVHKKGRTACLPPFLQSFGIHSRHPRASHPTGQELSKKR